MRICSLLPSATEIAFALGLGDQVVGVTHECDYPPEARTRPVVVKGLIDPHQSSRQVDSTVGERLRAKKGLYAIDLALFREASPDFVLTQQLCDVCAVDYDEVVEASRALPKKPTIVSLSPNRLADLLHDIKRVGKAAGKEKEAEGLVRSLLKRIEAVRERASGSDHRPKVACLEWLDPIYSAGHWVPEMVEMAGGREGLAKKGEPSRRIEWNEVVDLAPDVLVLMPCGFDIERTLKEMQLLTGLTGWEDLPAVRQHNVFAVNGHAYFNRPGPRLVDGLEILAQILHPEIFPRKAAPEAVRRIGGP